MKANIHPAGGIKIETELESIPFTLYGVVPGLHFKNVALSSRLTMRYVH